MLNMEKLFMKNGEAVLHQVLHKVLHIYFKAGVWCYIRCSIKWAADPRATPPLDAVPPPAVYLCFSPCCPRVNDGELAMDSMAELDGAKKKLELTT
jgi:hypothetical protein